ncbi:MAG: hypothetical protein DMG69_04725 [Acidobacteria bacterium]|nr:MAG: hypothetical protein DMG69_04725 [Acidobacteriota bacterium]
MKTISSFASRIVWLLFILSAAVTAFADPPSRVARLQYVSGEISVQPGGVNDWVPAVVNRPLTTADRVWADQDSRTELHLGNAYLRMNAETSLTLTNLTDQTVQVELDQGALNLRIRHLYDGEIYEVDTPNLAFTVTESGDYRFDVDPNSDVTFVSVWKGEGVATGQGPSVEVHRGDQARFSDGDSLNHEIAGVPDFDGFDDWCRVRNQREDHYQSARYVSPDVIGAEDLDDYGTWRVLPTYGAVWVPRVDAGWAPYRYGHWVWVEPWGWTWVDDAPWGFAPCHYGRWIFYRGYWGWVPGPARVRPVYAPALVAWVGGSHLSVSVSFGGGSGIAWFPLGYGEPYIPPYGASRNYFHNVNVSNTRITNITNITNNYYVTNNTTNVTTITAINGNHNNVHINYANQAVPGAVTAVSNTVLVNSQPVGRHAVRISEREIHSAPVAVGPAVAPSQASVLGVNAGAASSMAPRPMVTRPVVAKMPAPPKPVPFAMKQQALAEHPGRPLDDRTEQQMRIEIAQRRNGAANAPRATPSAGPMKPAPRWDDGNRGRTQPAPGASLRNVPRPPDRNSGQTQPMHTLPAVATPRPGPMTPAPRTSDENRATAQPSTGSPVRAVPRPPTASETPRPTPVSAPERPAVETRPSRQVTTSEPPRREQQRAPEPSPRQEVSDRRPDPGYRPVTRQETQAPRAPEPPRPVMREAPRQQPAPRVEQQQAARREAPARSSGGSQGGHNQAGKDDSRGQHQK